MNPTQREPRLFQLIRQASAATAPDTGPMAEGVEWSDGTVTLRWRGQWPATSAWEGGIDAMLAVHAANGITALRWLPLAAPTTGPPPTTGPAPTTGRASTTVVHHHRCCTHHRSWRSHRYGGRAVGGQGFVAGGGGDGWEVCEMRTGVAVPELWSVRRRPRVRALDGQRCQRAGSRSNLISIGVRRNLRRGCSC